MVLPDTTASISGQLSRVSLMVWTCCLKEQEKKISESFLNTLSAVIVFKRHNLTSVDVRF